MLHVPTCTSKPCGKLKPSVVDNAPISHHVCVLPTRQFGHLTKLLELSSKSLTITLKTARLVTHVVRAIHSGKLSLASGNINDSTFVCSGFSNWKDAILLPLHV